MYSNWPRHQSSERWQERAVAENQLAYRLGKSFRMLMRQRYCVCVLVRTLLPDSSERPLTSPCNERVTGCLTN